MASKYDFSDLFEDGYQMGVNHVINKVRDKLYYIPDVWKEKGDTAALYSIIDKCLDDCKKSFGVGG